MITIFTNIKNENRYLEQWLEYHVNLGFDQIILFEDEGSKSHKDIITKFDARARILLYQGVLKNNSGEFKDLTCFKFVFQNHPEITWGIKLDPDEYLDLGGYSDIKHYMSDLCGSFDEQITEVIFNWRLHNANGRIYPPNSYKYDLSLAYTNFIDFDDLKTDIEKNVSENTYQLTKTLMYFKCFNDRSDDIINKNIAPNFPHRLLLTDVPVDAEVLTGAYIKHFITKSFDEYYDRLKNRGEYSPEWYRKLGDFFVLNPDMIPLKHDIELIYDINIDDFKTKLNVTSVAHSEE